MSKYIDADKIIYRLKDEMDRSVGDNNIPPVKCGIYFGLLYAKSLVETAETVEITRCKDCKFYEPYDKPSEDFDGRCFARECETDDSDFCNYGVMRKDTTSDAEIH